MLFRKIKLNVLIVLFSAITNMAAQEALPAAGGEATGTDGSASYTIGQTVYKTIEGTNGNSAVEGVQQPYEISIVTAIENTKDIILEFYAYPNPTSGILKLRTNDRDLRNISYRLFDMNGKLLKTDEIKGSETLINMQNLVPSVYFIKVTENDRMIKTFKIIKK